MIRMQTKDTTLEALLSGTVRIENLSLHVTRERLTRNVVDPFQPFKPLFMQTNKTSRLVDYWNRYGAC